MAIDKFKDAAVIHFNKRENKKNKYTFAIIFKEDTGTYRFGYTFFNPNDIYNRGFATKKAIGRALSYDASIGIYNEVVQRAGGTVKALFEIKKEIGDRIDKSKSTISSLKIIEESIIALNKRSLTNE